MKSKNRAKELIIFGLLGVVLILVSILTFLFVSSLSKRILKDDFDRNSEIYTEGLKKELSRYEDVLLSAKGLFESSEEGVNREEFNHFFDVINIAEDYPGISFVYFVEPVRREDLVEYLDDIRKDTSVNSTGYPFVSEIPEENIMDINYIIKYVEPHTESSLLHIGILENTSDVNTSASKALTSNDFAVSERFGFAQNDYIYQFYIPVDLPYSTSKGLLGLSFRTKNAFEQTISNLPEGFNINIHEFDSTSKPIYASDEFVGESRFSSETIIKFGDTQWLLVTSANNAFKTSEIQGVVPQITTTFVFFLLSLLYILIYRLYLSRKDVSEILESTESKFQVIFDESVYLLGLLDTEGNFLEVNKTALDLGQVKKEEIVGKKFWDTFWWQGDAKGQIMLEKAIKDAIRGKTLVIETEILGYKQGVKASIPIEFTLKPIKDSRGKVILLLPTGKDITDVKEYEQELERFKQAVENASDHIIFTDPDGTVLYANPSCSAITGYEPDEIIGANPKMWGGLMSKEFYADMWKVIKTDKKMYSGKLKNKRKNGDVYDASVAIFPILDDERNLKFFVGIERDITDEQEVDRLKTEFVSVASHQLRTPLTGIRWLLELIATNTKLSKEQQQIIDEITINTDRMVTLVNDLLDVSHIEAGRKFAIEPSKVKLKFLLKEAVDVNKIKAEKKKIKIELDLDKDVSLFIDANKVKEVISNLIDNAIKYSKSGKSIYVSTSVSKTKFEVRVKDEGVGIPRSQQNQVFNKFFRADNAVKMQASGSGLGLYIAKSIVEAHGGVMSFESEQDKGTTFIISMPITTDVVKFKKPLQIKSQS